MFIVELIPFTSVDEIAFCLHQTDKKYTNKVSEKCGRTFKEIDCKREDSFMVETHTFYKKYLFTKKKVAEYKVYYNSCSQRVSITDLKFSK